MIGLVGGVSVCIVDRMTSDQGGLDVFGSIQLSNMGEFYLFLVHLQRIGRR